MKNDFKIIKKEREREIITFFQFSTFKLKKKKKILKKNRLSMKLVLSQFNTLQKKIYTETLYKVY